MNRRSIPSFLGPAAALLALALAPGPAAAGSLDGAYILAHVAPHSPTSLVCSSAPDVDCTSFETDWPSGSGCDVWFVVAHAGGGKGIGGASFGLEYDQPAGLTQFGHVVCADLYYPNSDPQGHLFPDSGGGVRMVWDPVNHCQRTTYSSGTQANLMAVYMYAYAPGQLQITENRNLMLGPEFAVVDCENAETDLAWPDGAGVVGFGGEASYNPCGEPPPPPPPLRPEDPRMVPASRPTSPCTPRRACPAWPRRPWTAPSSPPNGRS